MEFRWRMVCFISSTYPWNPWLILLSVDLLFPEHYCLLIAKIRSTTLSIHSDIALDVTTQVWVCSAHRNLSLNQENIQALYTFNQVLYIYTPFFKFSRSYQKPLHRKCCHWSCDLRVMTPTQISPIIYLATLLFQTITGGCLCHDADTQVCVWAWIHIIFANFLIRKCY